jgi:hypothetical protein
MLHPFLNRHVVSAASSDVATLQSTAMTLGQLATVLQRLGDAAAEHPNRGPALPEVAAIVRDMGLGALSFTAVANLVDAVTAVRDRDVLSALSLKQLEELLARIE